MSRSVLGAATSLDHKLPQLSSALDVEEAARRFADLWQSTAGRSLAVTNCRRVGIRYEPQAGYVVTYHITGRTLEDKRVETIGVIEGTAPKVAHRLFGDDPRMRHLAVAADAEAMLPRFSELWNGAPIEDCEITPIRYKPGWSCVLRYDLHSGATTQTLFGKVFATAGDKAMATVLALHESTRGAPPALHIQPPVAYWPDLQLLLRSGIDDGHGLNVRLFDESVPHERKRQWMHGLGAGVADLHGSAAAIARRRTLEDDVRSLRDHAAHVAELAPNLTRRYGRALGVISDFARGTSEELVPTHGALRTDQLLVDDTTLVLIDFDGFCWANAARDIGNLLAYLDWKAIRHPELAQFIEQAERWFLDGYAPVRPAPGEEWLALYRAASMLKIAARRLRDLSVDEWPLIPTLVDRATATTPA